jgi:hypothetical protein
MYILRNVPGGGGDVELICDNKQYEQTGNVVWDLIPCSLVNFNKYFRKTYVLGAEGYAKQQQAASKNSLALLYNLED